MKKIFIEKIKIYGYHGCLPEEKATGQFFSVSGVLTLKDGFYGAGDDLANTVDYAEICARIEGIVKNSRFDIIESLADEIACALLFGYPGLSHVKIAVEKPSAPVPVSFETIGVIAERCWHTVYLSFGSNLFDREKNIKEAIGRLGASFGCRTVRCSELIETEPWGVADQPDFLNCALELKTCLEPMELLRLLKKTERDGGREPGLKWGARIIDIDILLYDNLVYSSEELKIPHPYMHEREFMLEPLSEIAPDAIHPLKNKFIRELLDPFRK